MAEIVSGPEIRQRAKMIGLPWKQVTEEANLNRNTLNKTTCEADGVRRSTLLKALRVVQRHEHERLRYLIGLHGVPEEMRRAS